ncbi:MAG: segregation ATPase FtsK/SpoIIIE, family, partial [Hyphomicrobiales bacterium]|nr:segregation ATPase FtsK/SpoIIIE, family [Hyphomicrobiales bacterium]
MPAVRYTLSTADFVSDELRAMLRRRMHEIIGAALLGVAGIAAVALATWSVQDPSLSHATNAPVRNMLGLPGAISADLMMQLLGVATVGFLFPVAAWGWRLLTHRIFDREKTRLVFWMIGAFAAAGFASCLPPSTAWPLPSGLGGVVGDAMLRVPVWVFGAPLFGTARLAVALFIGVVAFAALALAAGFGWHDKADQEEDEKPVAKKPATDEDDAEPRSLISLGWLYHLLYTAKTRMLLALPQLLSFRRRPRIVPLRDPSMIRMAEPNSEPYSNPALDQPDAIEEDEAEEAAPRKRAKPAPRVVKNRKGGYELPSLALLTAVKPGDRLTLSTEAIEENAKALESVLGDFGVRGEIINAHPGPVVTLYELEPAPGIKSSRVIGLADDIARSMSKVSARVAVVPGRNAIGIELPNPKREKVLLREQLSSGDYTDTQARLPLCLGKTIGGDPVIVDLARMPHLLIAGTTGSGKSVAINTMILSLMYRLRPDECRVIMIDPKMLELSVYDGIPHLLTPVVTDPKKAVVALKWAVREMEERYRKMSKLGVRNIDGYNARVAEAKSKGELLSRTVHTGYDKESGEAIYEKEDLELEVIPYIVVIVDEMA